MAERKKRRRFTLEPIDENRDVEPPPGNGWELVDMRTATIQPRHTNQGMFVRGTIYAVLLWEKEHT